MIDLSVNELGNITLDETQDIARVSDGLEVSQAVRTAMRSWLSEYFLDQGWGVDYLNKILKRPFKEARIDREVRRVLRLIDGVQSVRLVNLSTNDLKEIVGDIEVITIYGTETITL
jgi:hypothetical protein